MASTLVVDRIRWRRERYQKHSDRDAELSVEFIITMMESYETLVAIAIHESRAAERTTGGLERVLEESGAASARQKVKLLAPATIAEACEAAWQMLRDLRDTIAAGNAADSESFQASDKAFRTRLHHFRVEVRRHQGLVDADAISPPRTPDYRLLP
ncbi:hypothetical protein ACWCQL_15895 [Streptomyces sp. NPDC002073]